MSYIYACNGYGILKKMLMMVIVSLTLPSLMSRDMDTWGNLTNCTEKKGMDCVHHWEEQ
uniref:Uncharacterized protein n=1 Tax=Setaria viridis TaxID=4556 RepID=A0A4U6TR79_SETVI|nr:hypothetical protein SEVIR_7G074601v2 [Setaria viridis]